MKKLLLLTLFFSLPISFAFGQQCELVRFETKYACPPYVPPTEQALAYSLFQGVASNLSEETVIPIAVLGSSYFFDFKDDNPTEISTIASEKYKLVSNDPLVGPLASTIEYSFTSKRPDFGYYYLYRPDQENENTRILLFLHGFGGCFKYYIYFLKKYFPNDVIVFPVYGYSGGIITKEYLSDLWSDFGKKISICERKPWLMGISAGGYSVFRFYANGHNSFQGGVSIASLCPDNLISKLNKDMKLLMINGDREQGMSVELLKNHFNSISRKVDNFESELVDGTHFFLFTKEERVGEIIQDFIAE